VEKQKLNHSFTARWSHFNGNNQLDPTCWKHLETSDDIVGRLQIRYSILGVKETSKHAAHILVKRLWLGVKKADHFQQRLPLVNKKTQLRVASLW
jgi:hypothetical protein